MYLRNEKLTHWECNVVEKFLYHLTSGMYIMIAQLCVGKSYKLLGSISNFGSLS